MFKLLRRVSTVCKIMWKERAGVDGLNPFGQRNRCFFNGRVVFRFCLDIRYGVHPLYSYLISSVVMGFQKSWLIYILQKNPKIHPDPYTQGSYLQKKPTWSLYTGFSSPCKLSRNPALCFSFPTLLTSSIIVIVTIITITIIIKPGTVLKIHHSAINASLLLIRDYRKES